MILNMNKASQDGKPFVDPSKSRWFNNQQFRQAVAHAINRQQMQDNLFRGIGAIQNSPLGVQSPYYAGPEDGVPNYKYDLEQAKALLKHAGFTYNSKNELLDAMRQELAGVPGLQATFGQPISHRVDHMLSGTRANVAINSFSVSSTPAISPLPASDSSALASSVNADSARARLSETFNKSRANFSTA